MDCEHYSHSTCMKCKAFLLNVIIELMCILNTYPIDWVLVNKPKMIKFEKASQKLCYYCKVPDPLWQIDEWATMVLREIPLLTRKKLYHIPLGLYIINSSNMKTIHCPRDTFGMIGQTPSVSKSNRLHVEIFWASLLIWDILPKFLLNDG